MKKIILIASLILLSRTFNSNAQITAVASGNWSNPLIWSTGLVPAATSNVLIGGGFSVIVDGTDSCLNLILGDGTNPGTLSFNANTNLFLLGPLTVGNGTSEGNMSMSNGGTLTTSSLITANAGTWIPGTGTIALTGSSTLPALFFTSFYNLTCIADTINLGMGITVNGTLSLNEANLVLGNDNLTILNTISLTGSVLSGTGEIIIGSSTAYAYIYTDSSTTTSVISAPISLVDTHIQGHVILSIAAGNVPSSGPDLSITSVISATSNRCVLTKADAGILALSGASTFQGGFELCQGVLYINNEKALGKGYFSIDCSGGQLIDNTSGNPITLSGIAGVQADVNFSFIGTNPLNLGASTFNLAGSINITTIENKFTIAGPISDFGTGSSISKDGEGTLLLSGLNTYSGGTTLLAGELDINDTSALGTGSFTIGSGSIIDNTSGSAITLSTNNSQTWNGDFTFRGSNNLNMGTGAITLDSSLTITVNADSLMEAGAISSVSKDLTISGAGILAFGVNPVSLNNLTIDSGSLVSTTGDLILSGNFKNSGAFASNKGTVIFSGTSNQSISGLAAFNNLSMANASGLSLTSNELINGTLNFTSAGLIFIGSNNLVLSGLAQITGSGNTAYVVTNESGYLTRDWTAPGTFTYPLGDSAKNSDYSPLTVTLTSGTFTGNPRLSVQCINKKDPNNGSSVDLLNRYWNVQTDTSVIHNYNCNLKGTYLPGDVTGVEAGIASGLWIERLPWTKFSMVDDVNHQVSASAVGYPSFDLSGISLQNPYVSISPIKVCINAPEISAVTEGDDPMLTYLWNTTASSPSINAVGSGIYRVTVTDGNGFTATAAQNIVVDSLPPAPVITPGGPILFCEGGDVVLTASAGSSYVWSTGDTSKSITVSVSGRDSVMITGSDGCVSPSSRAIAITVNVCTDVLQETGLGIEKLAVYPNPSSGSFTVNLPGINNELIVISATNALGQIVYQKLTTAASYQVNLSECPNGIYFLTLLTSEGSFKSKIVLEK